MLDTETNERAHYRYMVETFWFGVIANVVGYVLTIVVIGCSHVDVFPVVSS